MADIITVKHKGNFRKIDSYLSHLQSERSYMSILNRIGNEGIELLAEATPKDTGKTAASWDYTIEDTGDGIELSWYNTNYNDGECIALLIQYGHGTKQGVYISGIDYINPVAKQKFKQAADEIWKELVQ